MTWCTFKRVLAVASIVFFISFPNAATGQTGLDPGQLPKSTVFYLAWHGMPSGQARKDNSLLSLWDDPDFAPIRAAIFESIMSGSPGAAKPQNELSRDELLEVASLLDNELVVGYLADPTTPKAIAPSKGGAPHWQGTFLVYDRSGKEATLAKLIVRTRMSEKNPPKISTTTVAGIPAMKLERASGTSYWVEDGKYAYSASEPAVLEQIVAWTKHTSAQPALLSKTAAYQVAGSAIHGGVVEFFVSRILPPDASAGGFRLSAVMQNLRLDAVHAIGGKLTLEGARTRIQGAILGDTSAGTPFDFWGDGVSEPSSLQFAGENAVSFQSTRINLLGIYELVKRAFTAASGSKQAGAPDLFEQAAQTRLGMSLTDALGSFSGEFASVQPNAAFDPERQLYFVGIRKKPEVLKLLRAGLEERLSGERSEGDTTFFRVSEGGIQSEKGTAAWKYYHLAVTPDAILVSGKSEVLREALARRKSQSTVPSRLPQTWQTARAQFPQTVNGLSFIDLQKFDWTAIRNRWDADTKKNIAQAPAKSAPTSSPFESALRNLDPRVFQRHLHLSANASWKDAQGMHLDGWIE